MTTVFIAACSFGKAQRGNRGAGRSALPRIPLRIDLAGGPRAKTPIQTHPGSESFYVLTGKLGQRTPQGESQAASHASIK